MTEHLSGISWVDSGSQHLRGGEVAERVQVHVGHLELDVERVDDRRKSVQIPRPAAVRKGRHLDRASERSGTSSRCAKAEDGHSHFGENQKEKQSSPIGHGPFSPAHLREQLRPFGIVLCGRMAGQAATRVFVSAPLTSTTSNWSHRKR